MQIWGYSARSHSSKNEPILDLVPISIVLFGFPLPRTHANECYYRRALIHTQIITDDDLRRLYEAVKTKDISKLTPKQRLIYSFYLRSNVEMGGAALF